MKITAVTSQAVIVNLSHWVSTGSTDSLWPWEANWSWNTWFTIISRQTILTIYSLLQAKEVSLEINLTYVQLKHTALYTTAALPWDRQLLVCLGHPLALEYPTVEKRTYCSFTSQ